VFLGNPSLPISISREEARNTVSENIEKTKKLFQIEEQELVLTPFYLIHFDIFKEKEVHGIIALNAVTRSFSEELGEEIEKFSDSLTNSIEETDFTLKKTFLEQESVEKIAKAKLASENKCEKEDIILSSIKLVYFPEWHILADVESNKTSLVLNASTGQIFGLESIPEKEKGYAELARETLQELCDPKKWIEYGGDVVKIAGEKTASQNKNLSGSGIIERIKKDFRLQTLILFLILLIVVFVI